VFEGEFVTESAKYTVKGLSAPQRLDKVLRAAFPDWSRRATDAAINEKRVSVNGKPVWLGSWQVRNGDKIAVADPPEAMERGPQVFDPAWVIADTGAVIAIDKPAGLLSEANRWGKGVNLWALAEAHFNTSLTLFHRLDRDTSGVVLFTRPTEFSEVNRLLAEQFQQRKVQKTYLAHVAFPNRLAAEGEIRLPIDHDPKQRDRVMVVRSGGQWARTLYRTETRRDNVQPVWLYPETGRTHQLRVHLAALGAPILGDRVYGKQDSAPRLMLHAWRVAFTAFGGNGDFSFTAPLPSGFWSSSK